MLISYHFTHDALIILSSLALIYLMLSTIAGFAFGTIDFCLPHNFFKRTSFGKVVILRVGIYTIVFLLLTILGIIAFSYFDKQEADLRIQTNFLFSAEMLLLLFYYFFVVFQIHFVREVDRKFGPGNLSKMLLGSFHQPKEEERVFMFLDLKSSTSIAEQIGHIKYSKLIQDCFSDLRSIFQYQAEVYQYVGDEVVLTWPKEKGIQDANCLLAFFSYKKQLQNRAAYYQKNYGVIPQFKAGLHAGKIVVAEVGEEKREIAYHGDTINTAARIQSECKIQGEEILISKELFESVSHNSQYHFHSKGEVLLKGKRKKVEIYSVGENELK